MTTYFDVFNTKTDMQLNNIMNNQNSIVRTKSENLNKTR